jgi:hypothetical protein
MPHAVPAAPPSAVTILSSLADMPGDPGYHKQRDALRQRLASQLPKDLLLPSTLLDSLPLDVTSIPSSCGLLSASELAIAELDATTVRDRIAAGQLSAVDAVSAFGRRAAIAQQLTSCASSPFASLSHLSADPITSSRSDRFLPQRGNRASEGSRRALLPHRRGCRSSSRRPNLHQRSHAYRGTLGVERLLLERQDFGEGLRHGCLPSQARSCFLRQDESAAGDHAPRMPQYDGENGSSAFFFSRPFQLWF